MPVTTTPEREGWQRCFIALAPYTATRVRPHITLARSGRKAAALDHATQATPNMLARFEWLILYSSTLAPNGARYRALANAPV